MQHYSLTSLTRLSCKILWSIHAVCIRCQQGINIKTASQMSKLALKHKDQEGLYHLSLFIFFGIGREVLADRESM